MRCINTRPSEKGKKVIQTKLVLYFFNESEKNIHKLSKSSARYISRIIQKFLWLHTYSHNPNYSQWRTLDVVISEVVTDKNFQKSEIEKKTFESKNEIKYPQENDSDQTVVFISDDLNEKERNRLENNQCSKDLNITISQYT